MELVRINGYLHEVRKSHSVGKQEEIPSAEEHFAAQGIPDAEIKRLIIEAE